MDGKSYLPILKGKKISWRDSIFYEYYWEYAFPQTPTVFALRGEQFKYINYYGLWDINELYDIKSDPLESKNLIYNPEYRKTVDQMREQLFKTMKETNGMFIPLKENRWGQQNKRRKDKADAADFPPELILDPKDQ
jgi:N-acetylglucosamine-6-sulfatase